MKAVRIPTTGPVEVVDLVEAAEDDAQAFLTELYSVIGTDSVECVRVTDAIDAWLWSSPFGPDTLKPDSGLGEGCPSGSSVEVPRVVPQRRG